MRDKLKQAAGKYALTLEGVYEYAGNRTYVTEHMEDAFLAGASYMQARILELLRSPYPNMEDEFCNNTMAVKFLTNWLEAQLQKDSE